MGIIHKNMTVEQAGPIRKVKKLESGVVKDPSHRADATRR